MFTICSQCRPPKSFWNCGFAKHQQEEHPPTAQLSSPNLSSGVAAAPPLPRAMDPSQLLDTILEGAADHAGVFMADFQRFRRTNGQGQARPSPGCGGLQLALPGLHCSSPAPLPLRWQLRVPQRPDGPTRSKEVPPVPTWVSFPCAS